MCKDSHQLTDTFDQHLSMIFSSHMQFQKLSSYYLQESEWFHKNHIPSFKDQMDVSVMTGGAQMACVGILFGMDDVAPDAFKWAIGCSDSAKTVGAITRYANDLAAFKVQSYS